MRSLSGDQMQKMTRFQLVEEIFSLRSELYDANQLINFINNNMDDGMFINGVDGNDIEDRVVELIESTKRVNASEDISNPRPKI